MPTKTPVQGPSARRSGGSLVERLRALHAPSTVHPAPPQGGYLAKMCAEKARKDFSTRYTYAPQASPSPSMQLLLDSGVDFEIEIGKRWARALKGGLLSIPACDRSVESKRLREEMTMEAMSNPGDVKVIWNARIPAVMDLSIICEPDALVRIGRRSDGKWSWAPVDVKWHRSLEGSAKATPKSCSTIKAPHPSNATDVDLGVGVPHKSDTMQLAHYMVALEHYGHSVEPGTPYYMCGAIIGKEGLLLWANLNDKIYAFSDGAGSRTKKSAIEIYLEQFSFRLKVIENALAANEDPSIQPITLPEWKAECKECPWQIVCHDELKFDLGHHITLLPGMTAARAKLHYALGNTSAVQLARLDYPTAVAVDNGVDLHKLRDLAHEMNADPDTRLDTLVALDPGLADALEDVGFVSVSDLDKIHDPTAAYISSKVNRLGEVIDQARVSLAERVHRARGVDFVAIDRAVIEEDVDIEDANGRCYLIGVLDTGMKKKMSNRKMRREYYAFVDWTGTDEGEARIFGEWWAHVTRMQSYARDNHYKFRVYHYTDHETRYFRSLASKHAGIRGVPQIEELEAFFAGNSWVDLYPIVAKQLVWPTEDLTLKSLAKYVKFFWRDEAPGGGNSIAWYQEAIKTDAETVTGPDLRGEARTRLLQYNEDDVLATWTIRDWISRLGEARRPGRKLPSVEFLDSRFRWVRD